MANLKDEYRGRVCDDSIRLFSFKNMAAILDIVIGLIAVSFINCSALGGAVILPFRKKRAYSWILSAFIGLGKFFFNVNIET